METNMTVEKIVKVLDNKKAEEIKVIKISELTVLADYFIIANGTSNTHVRALAEEAEYKKMKMLQLLGSLVFYVTEFIPVFGQATASVFPEFLNKLLSYA